MAENQEVKASLGCGTLILIAVIVLLFGGSRDHERLERKIDALQAEIRELKEALGEPGLPDGPEAGNQAGPQADR